MTDLLPCPVCDRPPRVRRPGPLTTVACCSILCPPVVAKTVELAYGSWNKQARRALADPALRERDRLRVALMAAQPFIEDAEALIVRHALGETLTQAERARAVALATADRSGLTETALRGVLPDGECLSCWIAEPGFVDQRDANGDHTTVALRCLECGS